jgi:TetR/AcrR family transcriptional repressor of nem operon
MTEQANDTKNKILTVGRRLTAQRGYSRVGLNELLTAAEVPKGSFYHYFPSKDAYGCALLDDFVAQYSYDLSETLNDPTRNARDQFLAYFDAWKVKQTSLNFQDRCLVVKLSAEVADLSETMSAILKQGVDDILKNLTKTLDKGVSEGSIKSLQDTAALAQSIYYQWLGASLVAGLSGNDEALEAAMKATKQAISTT